MRNYVYISAVIMLFNTCCLYAAPVVPAQTTWDSGTAEGWTWDVTEALVQFPLTGGVSGGFLQATDIKGGEMTIYAPAAFLGDYTALNNNAYFSVSLRTLVQGSDKWHSFGILTLSGPGGSYSVDLGNPPEVSGGWIQFTRQLTESKWTKQSGTWAGLLANVTSVSLNIEAGSAITETNGVDNFALVGGSLDTPRIVDIRVNHCGRRDFGWYFIGHDGIELVEIFFSHDVAGASTISNFAFSSQPGEPLPPNPTYIGYDANRYCTTLAWGSPILNQSMTITCKSGAARIRALSSSEPLDGEWVMGTPDYPVFPSGDGISGGDAQLTLYHLMGDINRDFAVNLLDVSDLASRWLDAIP